MKNISYEKALEELQQIVQQLEENAVSIDDITEKTKRAAELIRFCKEQLRAAEDAVERMLE